MLTVFAFVVAILVCWWVFVYSLRRLTKQKFDREFKEFEAFRTHTLKSLLDAEENSYLQAVAAQLPPDELLKKRQEIDARIAMAKDAAKTDIDNQRIRNRFSGNQAANARLTALDVIASTILFGGSALLAILMFESYEAILHDPVEPRVPMLGVPYTQITLPIVTLVVAGLLVLHRASVRIVKALYDVSLLHSEHSNNKKLFGNRACGYCGAEKAPILCGTCDSIQWSAIESADDPQWYPEHADKLLKVAHNPLHHEPWLRSLATLFAHNRIAIGGGVVASLIVGLLSFTVQARSTRAQNQEAERTEQTKRAGEAIRSSAAYRAALWSYRMSCMQSDQLPDSAYCVGLRDIIIREYYLLSWNAGPAIEYLQLRQCNHATGVAEPVPNTCGADGMLGENARPYSASEARNAACRAVARYDLVGSLDEYFRRFMGAQTDENAKRLMNGGRQLSCILLSLDSEAAGHSEQPSMIHASCTCAMPPSAAFVLSPSAMNGANIQKEPSLDADTPPNATVGGHAREPTTAILPIDGGNLDGAVDSSDG